MNFHFHRIISLLNMLEVLIVFPSKSMLSVVSLIVPFKIYGVDKGVGVVLGGTVGVLSKYIFVFVGLWTYYEEKNGYLLNSQRRRLFKTTLRILRNGFRNEGDECKHFRLSTSSFSILLTVP